MSPEIDMDSLSPGRHLFHAALAAPAVALQPAHYWAAYAGEPWVLGVRVWGLGFRGLGFRV